MIYKGSHDGFKSSIFHYKCDNQGATYTIAKSENNIFGGYNPHSWSSDGNVPFSNGKDSFLFSLVNSFNIPPMQFKNTNEEFGPYNDSRYLPSFGKFGDLSITDDCTGNQDNRNYFDSYETLLK